MEESDSEYETEEAVVLVELNGIIDSNFLHQEQTPIKILGIETDEPILQIGHYIFSGHYEDTLGTVVAYEPTIVQDCDGKDETTYKFLAKTDKKLSMKRIFLEKKEQLYDKEPAANFNYQNTAQANNMHNGLDMPCTSNNEINHILSTQADWRPLSTPDERLKVSPVENGKLSSDKEIKMEISSEANERKISTDSHFAASPSTSKNTSDKNVSVALSNLINNIEQSSPMANDSKTMNVIDNVRTFNTDADLVHKSFKEKWKREKSKKKTKYETSVMPPQLVACDSDSSNKKAFGNFSSDDDFVSELSENDYQVVKDNDCEATHFSLDSDVSQSVTDSGNEINNNDTQNQLVQSSTDENITFVSSSSKPKLDDDKCSSSGDTDSIKVNELSTACESSVSEFIGTSEMSQNDSENNASSSTNNLSGVNNSVKSSIYEISQSYKDNLIGQELSASSLKDTNECQTSNSDSHVLIDSFPTDTANVATSSILESIAMEVDDNQNLSSSEITQSGNLIKGLHKNSKTLDTLANSENSAFLNSENKIDNDSHGSTAVSQDSGSLSEVSQSHDCETKKNVYSVKGKGKFTKDDVCSQSTDSHTRHLNKTEIKSSYVSSCDSNKSGVIETSVFNSSATSEECVKLSNETCEVTQSDRNAKKESSNRVEKSFSASTSTERMSQSSHHDSEVFTDIKDPCASSDDVNIISHSKSNEVKKKNSNRNSSCEVTQSFGCDEEFLMAKDECLDDKSGTNECEVFQPCEDIQRFSHVIHISETKDICVSSDDVNNSPSREIQNNTSDTNCEVSQSVHLDQNVPPRMPSVLLDVKNSACEVTQSSLAEIKQTTLSSSGESSNAHQIINESASESSEHMKEECVSSADTPFKTKRKKSTKESKYGEVTQSYHHNTLLLQREGVLCNIETEASNECEDYDQSSNLSGTHEVAVTSETETDVCESSDDINISNSNHLDDNKNYISEVSQSSKYEYVASASVNSDKVNISSECDIISHSFGLVEEQLDVSSGESASNLCESSDNIKFETVDVTSCDPDECTSTNRYMNKSENAQKQRHGAPCPEVSDMSMSVTENQDLSSSVSSHISDSSSVNSSVIVSSSIECLVSNDACIIYSSSSNASTSSSGKSVKYRSSVKMSPFSDHEPQKQNIVSNNIHQNVKLENKIASENESVSYVQSSNDIELDENIVSNVSGSVDLQKPSAQTHIAAKESHIMADKEIVESSNVVPSTSNASKLNESFGSEFPSDVMSVKTIKPNTNDENAQDFENLMKTKGKKRKILSPAREAEPLKKKILSRAIKGQTVEKDNAHSSTFQSNASSSSVSRESSRPSLLEVMVSSASDFRNSLIQDGNAFGKKTSHLSSSGEEVQSSLSSVLSNEALPSTNNVSPSKIQENSSINASSSDSQWIKKADSVSVENKNSDSNPFDMHSNQYQVSQSSEIINTHSSTNHTESLPTDSAQQDLVQSSTSISIALANHSTNKLTASHQVTSADETVMMPSQNCELFKNSGLETVQVMECMEPKPSICENELIESEISSSPCELYYSQQNSFSVDGSGQCAVVEGNYLENAANDNMLNVNEDDISCNVIVTSVNYDLVPLTSTSGADSETNKLNISHCDAYLSSSASNQPFDTFQCESPQEAVEKFHLRAQNLESVSSDIGSSSEAVKINLNSTSTHLQMDCTNADILSSANEVGMNSSDLIIETDLSGSTVNEIIVDMYEESSESFERESKESTLCEVTESHSGEQELNALSVNGVVSCSSAKYVPGKKEYYDNYIYQGNDLPSTNIDKPAQDVVSSFEDVIVDSNVLPIENVSQSENEQIDSVLCSDSADLVDENVESSLNLPIYSVNESIPDVSSLPNFSSVSECEQQPSFIENSYISSKIHSFTSDTCHLPSVSNIDDSSESSISQQGHLVTQSSDSTSAACEAGATDAEKLYSDSNGSSSSEFSDVQDTEMWTQPESFDYGETEIPEELLGPSTAFIFHAGEDPDTSSSRENA